MDTTDEQPLEQPSRNSTTLIWALRLLIVAIFVPAGIMKITGTATMVTEFQTLGLGDEFRHFTGIVELVGGTLALVPALSVFGTLLLLAVDIGAFVAQVTVLHIDWIHTVVIGALLAVLAYQQGRQIFSQPATW